MKLFNLAQETIDFQLNDPFPKECDAIIESIFNKIESLGKTRDYCTYTFACNNEIEQLQDLIFKRFGLKNRISCINSLSMTGAVSTPFGSKNIFFRNNYLDYFSGDKNTKKRETSKINYEINLNKAFIKGDLVSKPIDIYLNLYYFFHSGTTEKEVTAIILHEIGHIFTNFEYGYLLESGNLALLELVKGFKDKDSKTIKQAISYLCVDPCDVTPEDVLNDFTVFCPLVYRKYFDNIRSQFGHHLYDNVSAELSADIFVVRFGYQVHLATMLEKIVKDINKHYSSIYEERNAITNVFLLSVLAYIFYIAGTAGGAATLMTMVIVLILVYITEITPATDKLRDNNNYQDEKIYDEINIRVLRLKQQSIVYLKEIGTEPSLVKKFIKDIDLINSKNLIIDEKNGNFFKMVNKIDQFLNSPRKTREYYYQLQRDLEEIGYNELFVESQRFRHL